MPPKGRGMQALSRRIASIENISRERLKDRAQEEIAASKEHFTVAKATKDGYDRVKKEYEGLMMAIEQVETPDQFWKVDNFIYNTKAYFSYLVQTGMKGRIDDHWQVSTLYYRKGALCLWAIYKMDLEFSAIYASWSRQVYSHIHMLAHKYGCGTASRPKAYYGPEELTLLMGAVLSETSNTEHSFQMYVAFTMGVIFGPRAGSLGQSKYYRGQFLRWEDITFTVGPERQIVIKILLKWLKGKRDPYIVVAANQRAILQCPTFHISPRSRIQDLPCDLTISLTILAINRGRLMFDNFAALEAHLNDPNATATLPVNPSLDKCPVFLAPNAGNTSGLSDKPLNSNSFHPTLQRLALAANILGAPPTMHSFRRETFSSLYRSQGKDLGKAVLAHAPGGQTYAFYDWGIGDKDIAAARLGQPETSRDSIRMAERPSVHDFVPNSLSKLDNYKLQFLRKDQRYQELQSQFAELLRALITKYEIIVDGKESLEALTKKLSPFIDDDDDKNELEMMIYERKLLRKTLGNQAQRAFSIEEAQDHAKTISIAAKEKLLHERQQGFQGFDSAKKTHLGGIRAEAAHEVGESSSAAAAAAAAAAPDEPQMTLEELDESEPFDNINVLIPDEIDQAFDKLALDNPEDDEISADFIVEFASDNASTPMDNAERFKSERRKLVKAFENLVDLPSSGLKCSECLLDPFATPQEKERVYVAAKLAQHLVSNRHTTIKTLWNAFQKCRHLSDDKCPICDEKMLPSTASRYEHLETHHGSKFGPPSPE